MVKLIVKFCLVMNPYLCQSLEMAPDDHVMVSIAECIRGGALGGMTFTKDHMEWQTHGWRCVEIPNQMQVWKDRHKELR